jgi:hypothetical protein
MMEKQPQILLETQADLKAETSGPERVHIMSGEVDMLRPWMQYSGKTMKSIRG